VETSGWDITWCDQLAPPTGGPCLACGAVGPHQPVLTVPNAYVAGDIIRFARCRACGSLVAAAGRFIEYTDDDGLDPAVLRHYLHIGAGIDSMVRPIERIRADGEAPSLLDVGCGFGFTLDYWGRMTGAEVAGVEPSEYGRMGRDMLGVPIHIALLSHVPALRERRYEIVFSSEVVEHVSNPAAFLTQLRAHLEPTGTLVLTTPRAEFVQPDSPLSMLLAVLSPGLHKLLFSAPALEALLRAAGFAHVLVEAQTERLVAFAAERRLCVRPADESLTRRYHDYVRQRAALLDQPTDLALGFRFRAAKELVNNGRALGAATHADVFAALVRQHYGYDPLDFGAVRARVLPARSLRDYADVAPFCLGPFLFYRAMAENISGDDAMRTADLFALAFDVLKHAVTVAPEYAQEAAALVWIAALEYGCALLSAGRREEAIAVFDTIPTQAATVSDSLGFATPYVEARTAFERAVALLQLGRYPEAITGFADAMAKPGAAAGTRSHAHRLLREAANILRTREPGATRDASAIGAAAPSAPGLLIWEGGEPAETACPICFAAGAKPFRVRSFRGLHALDGAASERQPLDFYACPDCDSVFPHPFAQPRYENDFGYPDYSRLYAQVWAGIEFMIRPLIAVNRLRPVQSFVDAGCGFGYTVDFAQRMFGARALGLDPSAYARDGARALGVEILPAYLSDEPLPDEMRPDLLFCSEVIEHVEDPAGFTRMLRGHLQQGGVLALTTPDAECVTPGHPAPAVAIVSSLFPGFHRQIFSERGLAANLHGAGFAHARIFRFACRLVAFASDDATVLNITLEPDYAAYAAYLEALAGNRDPAGADVRQGALYKQLAQYVSEGDWPRAEAAFAAAEEILQHDYGLSFAEPEEVPARIVPIIQLPDLPAALPYWLPFGLYFAGMLLLNGREDAVGARRLFSSAHHAIAEAIRLGLVAEAPLYWQAVLHDGITALVAGDNVGAEAELDRIVAAGKAMPATLQLTELKPATVARAYVQRGVARLRLANPVDAASDFAVALDAAPLLPEAEARMVLDLLRDAADAIDRAEFNAQLAARDREIAELKRAVDVITSSRSWRFTAPFRKTVTGLKSLYVFSGRQRK
jgi:2-polyprenyl-3-methyl-5-hydroxy-6-metoxy-1,4-benzoquinol methylase/tetratricopeptide (TPR) repeat protein